MNRGLTLALVLALSVLTSSVSKAAPISALFVGSFTSTNNDFLGTGVPTPFYLNLTFNDNGLFGSGLLRTQAGVNLATIDTANAGWSLGDGGSDTLSVLAGTSIPNRFLNFTLTGPSNTIASTSTANASVIAPFLFSGASALPAAITFTNFLNQGYAGQITAIPEPASMGLLLGVVAGAGMWHKRRNRKTAQA